MYTLTIEPHTSVHIDEGESNIYGMDSNQILITY